MPDKFLTYAEILRKKPKKKSTKLRGGQEVPMDLDKINESWEATQKPPQYDKE